MSLARISDRGLDHIDRVGVSFKNEYKGESDSLGGGLKRMSTCLPQAPT